MGDTKIYRRNTVVFREGDPGDCMYQIETGMVGIYHDYGGKNETQIATLDSGKVFGEMGLLDHAPRSATVVVLEKDTMLTKISEESFLAFFEENPYVILDIMQQMCNRLRMTTKAYTEACHTVYDAVETEKSGKKRSSSLKERLQELCRAYRDFRYDLFY